MIVDAKQPILVQDVIRPILERLSFIDFHRARCVSSVWYSASKSCIENITYPENPWLILFQNEETNNGTSCKLFDPLDHNTYTIRDLGFNFSTTRCLASYGSWFLMLDDYSRSSFHLWNLFTRERITLPSLESISIFFTGDIRIGKAVLWVDEKTKDYLVVWNYDSFFGYYKKGDENKCWKLFQPLENQGCADMVFRGSKLYVLSQTLNGNITVFDFSRGGDDDSPIKCASFPTPYSYHQRVLKNLGVTVSGEVLFIARTVEPCYFTVYKMDPKSSKWSIIKSIGNEVLYLDLGITVARTDGAMRNCIYFSNYQFCRDNGISLLNDDNGICVYHIQTNKVVQEFQHLTSSSPKSFKDARWFLPTFGEKWLL